MHCSRLDALLRTLVVLVSLVVADARASMLPMTDVDQFGSRKLNISGCITRGTYDATSLVWRQVDSFDAFNCRPYPTVPGPGGTRVTLEGFETRLLGRVDHDGNVLSGTFMAFAAIPALGIDEPTLLMRGRLLEAYYGPALLSDVAFFGIGVNALVELDFALPLFGNPGDILLWPSNATVAGWDFFRFPTPTSLAWQTSVGEGGYHPYTNTQYMLYDRSVFFAPEPATLEMLGLGFVGIAAAVRRRLRPACDDGLANIVEQGFDAGIRLGEMVAQDMVSVRLTPPTRTVVIGSPAYFEKHGVPQRPEDLVQHDCVNYRQISSGGLYRWEFQRAGEEFEIAVKGRVIANDTPTLMRCAVDGLDLVTHLESVVRPWIARGGEDGARRVLSGDAGFLSLLSGQGAGVAEVEGVH